MIKHEFWVVVELKDRTWYTFSSHRTKAAARTLAKVAARQEHGYGSRIYLREIRSERYNGEEIT